MRFVILFLMLSFPLSAQESVTPFGAFARSLVVPGWGESAAGAQGWKRFFITTEIAFWASYLGFSRYGDYNRTAFQNYAAVHAGVANAGKDDQFYTDIGNFNSIWEHNEQQRRDREANNIYPTDREPNGTAEFYWDWGSGSEADARRTTFDDMRITSQAAYRNASLLVGMIFVNHAASAINAFWQARKEQNRISFEPVMTPYESCLQVTFHLP